MTAPIRLPPRIEPLGFFVGEWQIDAEVTDESGKVSRVLAVYTIKHEPGSGWLIGEATVNGLVVRDFWGWDAEAKDFVRIQLINDGSHGEIHSDGWHGDTLTWLGGGLEADGLRTRVRTTQKRTGENSLLVTWELLEGEKWRTYSRETLTRRPSSAP